MAVREYELSAAEDDDTARRQQSQGRTLSDLVRAANHLCYLYGSGPGRERDPASERLLPLGAPRDVRNEWAQVRDVWMKNLTPMLRK